MATDLKENLRKLLPHLKNSLLLSHVHSVASNMWSSGHFEKSDTDEIQSCKTSGKAVEELIQHVLVKELSCIEGLADAFKRIERRDLAERVYPPALAASLQPQPAEAPHQAMHSVQTDIHRQSTATGLQLAQGAVSTNVQTLYVAVQLRLSARGRYLEVQVLVGSDKPALQKWQQSVKKEYSDQHHMPEPELVTLSGFSIGQPIAVRLTSTTNSEATVCHHGCLKTSFSQQPHDNSRPNTLAWLFDLAEETSFTSRQYVLHLHRAMPAPVSSNGTPGDEILSDLICKALKIIPSMQERCIIYQLGFMEENLPRIKGVSGAQNFGRHAQPGDVIAVKTLLDITRYYQSITKLAQSVGSICGPALTGTGFCVGNNKQKYFMTCRHLIENDCQVISDTWFNITFQDLDSGQRSTVRGYCVAEDVILDYALLKVEDAEKAPPPIPCCTIDDAMLTRDHRYLTIIGFNGELVVDKAVELQTITKDQVEWVKDYVTACYLRITPNLGHQHIQSYVKQYDGIITNQQYSVFYNVAQHKQGSSGSPAFLYCPDGSVTLVALHRGGYPKFYYDDKPPYLARQLIPINFTVEYGTRLSAISANILARSRAVWQDIFTNVPTNVS